MLANSYNEKVLTKNRHTLQFGEIKRSITGFLHKFRKDDNQILLVTECMGFLPRADIVKMTKFVTDFFSSCDP